MPSSQELLGLARAHDMTIGAGLVEIENKQVDPIWAPYLGVADLKAIVAQAKALGGRILLEPSPELGEGRVALLADPTGGAFFVYELEEKTP